MFKSEVEIVTPRTVCLKKRATLRSSRHFHQTLLSRRMEWENPLNIYTSTCTQGPSHSLIQNQDNEHLHSLMNTGYKLLDENLLFKSFFNYPATLN